MICRERERGKDQGERGRQRWILTREQDRERKSEERGRGVQKERKGERERHRQFKLPDSAVWSSPSETLHRHCETSRESQRVRADMAV